MSLRHITTRLGLVAAAAATVTAGAVALAPTAGASTPAASPSAIGCNATAIFETDGRGATGSGVHWDAFNSRVPAGYAAQKVLYKDGVFPLFDQNPLDVAVADGIGKLDAAVRDFHARCPGNRIILAGYSEGAVVAGNEIENLSRTNVVPHNLINGVLYGDPRRPFGDGGVGGVAGGIETNLPTILPQVTMQGPHNFGDIRVHEVCNENDGICNSTNIITNAAAFANGIDGFLTGAHNYRWDPVADQGSGLTLYPQAPLIPYGPPIATGVGTPWQMSQIIPGLGNASVHAGMTTVNSLLPPDAVAALQTDPWYALASSA